MVNNPPASNFSELTREIVINPKGENEPVYHKNFFVVFFTLKIMIPVREAVVYNNM